MLRRVPHFTSEAALLKDGKNWCSIPIDSLPTYLNRIDKKMDGFWKVAAHPFQGEGYRPAAKSLASRLESGLTDHDQALKQLHACV